MRRPRRRRVFSDSSHVRFLAGGRIARAPFLTPAGCDTIVALSEAQAAEEGGWRGEEGYAQATVDLEVDRAPLFIYHAWQETHVPNEVPPEYETDAIDFKLRRVYEGMVHYMDSGAVVLLAWSA